MIWLGIAARWAVLRAIDRMLRSVILFGNPTIRQMQRRARCWGYRLEFKLEEIG